MKVCYIYKIINCVNNKCYIGFTNRLPIYRKVEHFSPCQYLNRKTKLYSAIKSYGKESFIFEVIYCSLDEEHCLKMESVFIKIYDSVNNGYNLTLGGDRQVFTAEIKNKISQSKMGHSVSHETRQKLSEINNKKWKIIYSDGREEIINNLKQFCATKNISYSHLTKRKKIKKLNITGMEMTY